MGTVSSPHLGSGGGPHGKTMPFALCDFLRVVLSSTSKGLFFSAVEKMISRVESLEIF